MASGGATPCHTPLRPSGADEGAAGGGMSGGMSGGGGRGACLSAASSHAISSGVGASRAAALLEDERAQLLQAARALEQMEAERAAVAARWGLGGGHKRPEAAALAMAAPPAPPRPATAEGSGGPWTTVPAMPPPTAAESPAPALSRPRPDEAGTPGGVVSAAREAAIREAVSSHVAALERSGAPQPWLLVERLGDEILEEILTSCAQGLYSAAGDCVEALAADELAVA